MNRAVPTAVIAAIITITGAGGCGDDTAETPKPISAIASPTASPTPEPTPTPYTANDPKLMRTVEREIKDQLATIADDNDGRVTDKTVHCSVESEIAFSCGGSVNIAFPGGFCGELSIQYRGSVDPNYKGSGDYWDWKADPSTSESSEIGRIC